MKNRNKAGFIILIIFIYFFASFFSTDVKAEIYSGFNKISQSENKLHIEDSTQRAEFTKHFSNGENLNTAISYPYAVHERNEKGEWVDIDNTLYLKGHRYKNSAKEFSVSFANPENIIPNEPTISINTLGEILEWTVYDLYGKSSDEDGIKACVYDETKEKLTDDFRNAVSKIFSSIVYKNYLSDGIDLEYVIQPYKVKENIIINNKTKFQGYSIKTNSKALIPVLTNENVVEWYNEKGKLYYISNVPYMYDANNEISYDIDLSIKEMDDSFSISFRPNSDWLNSEERVYPIVIDPVIESARTTSNINDTYVYNGCSASTARTGEGTLYVGIKSVNSVMKTHRVFWQSINLPSIDNPSFITDAKFVAKCWNGTTTSRAFSLYRANESWDGTTLTWSNMPSCTMLVQNVSRNTSTNEVVFEGDEVTSTVKNWYLGKNYGFMIRYTNESTTNPDYNIFYSCNNSVSLSYMPYLSITYTSPSSPISEGTYYIKNVYSGKYLTVSNDYNTDNVVQYDFVGSPEQRWEIKKKSNGYYELSTPLLSDFFGMVGDTELSLAVANGSNANGTNIKIASSSASSAQRFSIISCGNNKYCIVPKCANSRCLDVTGPSMDNNANIQLWTYDGVSQQQWVFEECVQLFQTKTKYIFDQEFNSDTEPPTSYSLKDDLNYSDLTKSEIEDLAEIDSEYIDNTVLTHRNNWESLVKNTSIGDLEEVGLGMVSHFLSGTFTNYVDNRLTDAAKEHSSTVSFIEHIEQIFDKSIKEVNGNATQLKFNNENRLESVFSAYVIDEGLQRPVFNKVTDLANGLMICVDALQGYEILLREWSQTGTTITGKLRIILYDHYGLEADDVIDYNFSGFKSWFILQHYNVYNNAYGPFITIMPFDVDFTIDL